MGDSFRPIDGFPGYRVNSHGDVQSCWNRYGCRGEMTDTWLPLKPVRSRWGHLSVNVHQGGKKVRRFIHHLVLEAFVGPRPPGLICCHYDGNPANNRLENLRWDTHQSNIDDMLRHGTRGRGETASRARLQESEVLEIRRMSADGASPDGLANRYGVGTANIMAIVKGRTWKHLP
jgi:HNH endonuclease